MKPRVWIVENETHIRTSIDPESGDVWVHAICVNDYNGYPVITVFCNGYPIMIVEPETADFASFEHHGLTPTGSFMPQAQSMVTFATLIEGVTSEALEHYVVHSEDIEVGWRVFQECFDSGGDGHETLEFVEGMLDVFRSFKREPFDRDDSR